MPTDDPLVWLREQYNDNTALLAKTFGNGYLGVPPDILAALIDVAEAVEAYRADDGRTLAEDSMFGPLDALDAAIRKEMGRD